ncbi:hypothetical protein D0Z00_001237 [Geotrichum galactomycetum]|uniref:Uncharacterized protein n=1 Tax=Geotrichum galactomycetum TaxID=27317 RepID=A0ACB6V7J0_9ASCO|nr:hypothetical protein D0Z00_001237 [Geotrichum candidum]
MSAAAAKKTASRYMRFNANRSATIQLRDQNQKNMLRKFPDFYTHQIKSHVDESLRLKANEWKYMAGDRVQILSGPEKGRIGKIAAILKESNAVSVEGLGGTSRILIPPQAFYEGQTRPIVDAPNAIPVSNIRLVATVKEENGTEKDVAVHSVSLEGEYYDADYNQFLPVRKLTHDRSVEIPWPRPAKPLAESEFATRADVVEERTFFPKSVLEPPLPPAAVSQIRNPYSRFKRRPVITAEDLHEMTVPVMPLTPGKKKYLAAVEALKKETEPKKVKIVDPAKKKEIEDFIGAEIQKGLQKRLIEEKAALQQYQ